MEKIKKKYIGDVIRFYRNLKSLTQEQLAEKLNISYQQLQQYEYNKSNPPLEILEKIIKILDIPLKKIFNISDKKDPVDKVNEEILKNSELLTLIGKYPESTKLFKLLEKYRKEINMNDLEKLIKGFGSMDEKMRASLIKFIMGFSKA